MPTKPPVACGYPMCPAYTTNKGRCDKHQPKKKGGSTAYRERSKFYGTALWKRIRHRILMKEPLCRECIKDDIVTEAVVVDHIIERKHGGSDNANNLQPLCQSCHSRKTMQDNR